MINQISDRFRSGTINYYFDSYGGGIPMPSEQLALIDEFGNEIVIQKSSDSFDASSCVSEESTPCIEISENGGESFFPLSSEDFRVVNAQFYIDPPESPLDGFNIQPRVTIVLAIQNNASNPDDRRTLFIQTTVSSRKLLR